ncbi:hypothetical protein ARMSODRAFT_946469 [Armillaria solidipes]|uniref:Uncharacterized protein n=1 Tax=Armillaria solidipes TaxID=1076256 RepID=A0A2H3CGV8_9AGAR|nr:hypothetical protein ARMSODRAFT_946469 [Armillaria solidipes]
MSPIVLPSRGQCIQITDDSQRCQCLWFFPPESPLLDQNVCGLCGHGIHAHVDYVSTVVNHYPVNQCAAYAQKTHLTQRCTCEAQFCEHIATDNGYRLPEPWTVLDYFNPDINGPSPSATSSSYSNGANSPFSPNTTSSSNYNTPMFSGDTTNIPFTSTYVPPPSPNANPSYPYSDTVIFAPIPQPVIQTAITQIEGYSHSEMENSYGVQYQDDNFSVNVQDSSTRFR